MQRTVVIVILVLAVSLAGYLLTRTPDDGPREAVPVEIRRELLEQRALVGHVGVAPDAVRPRVLLGARPVAGDRGLLAAGRDAARVAHLALHGDLTRGGAHNYVGADWDANDQLTPNRVDGAAAISSGDPGLSLDLHVAAVFGHHADAVAGRRDPH